MQMKGLGEEKKKGSAPSFLGTNYQIVDHYTLSETLNATSSHLSCDTPITDPSAPLPSQTPADYAYNPKYTIPCLARNPPPQIPK